jgi:cytochrome c oxidase assembly protein subunit 15
VDAVPTLVRTLAIALAFALPVQMALGGIVSSNYAGLACPEWPTCRAGVWFPAFADGIGLQILHRLGAYTVFGIVVALFATARKVPALRTRATLLLVVALLQVGLGVANIWLRLPVEIAIAHSGVADLLVLLTTLTVARALELPRAAAAGSPAAILPNPEPA